MNLLWKDDCFGPEKIAILFWCPRGSQNIDPEIINRAIFFEKAIEADSGMWPVGAWAHDPGVERPTFNLSKAQQYMTKSGSPEGFSFTAVTNTSPVLVPTAEIIRQMLKRINVDMKIEVLSAGSSTERFFHGQEYPLYLTAWSRYPEPDWLASLAYKSDGYYNAGNVDRPDLDRLVELGSAAYDREQRKRFYTELNSKVLSEAWFVPLLYLFGSSLTILIASSLVSTSMAFTLCKP